MLTLLLLVFGLGHTTTPPHPSAEDGPPTLIVQILDPVNIPLPASDVSIKPAKGDGPSKSEHVDQNGYAKFWVETGKHYLIEVKSSGFNKKTVKYSLSVPKPGKPPTAHLQIKLKPNEGSFGN